MRKTIKFDTPQIEFDEWLEPGYTKPNSVVRKFPINTELDDDSDAPRLAGRLYYQCLGSGSSGNCSYLGTDKAGILVDAGIKPDEVELALASNGVKMNHVKGILLTHDHTDHVKYVYQFLRKHKHIKVFCTNRVLNGLLRRHNISKRIKEYHVPVFKEIPFKILDFDITAFEVFHDGTDNVGFSILYDDKAFVLATDLGTISDRARHYMSLANYLVIEANYDRAMLLSGSYPEYLKARIMTDHGHMDNVDTARFLSEIIRPELKYIFLCHLSKDNNTPERAFSIVKEALEKVGKTVGTASETISDRAADVQLMTLPRYQPTRWFVFR